MSKGKGVGLGALWGMEMETGWESTAVEDQGGCGTQGVMLGVQVYPGHAGSWKDAGNLGTAGLGS